MQAQILLVDDEQDILDIGVLVLSEAGHRVARAVNADIALLLIQQGVSFDVLITDVVLPGMLDGFGLAHKVRQLLPHIAVVYSTGFTGVTRVRSQGAIYGEVLRKPWGADDLCRAVNAALSKRHDLPNEPSSGEAQDAFTIRRAI
jgi:DNA-binding NtrC family response regulator